jgi:hypothetical protein
MADNSSTFIEIIFLDRAVLGSRWGRGPAPTGARCRRCSHTSGRELRRAQILLPHDPPGRAKFPNPIFHLICVYDALPLRMYTLSLILDSPTPSRIQPPDRHGQPIIQKVIVRVSSPLGRCIILRLSVGNDALPPAPPVRAIVGDIGPLRVAPSGGTLQTSRVPRSGPTQSSGRLRCCDVGHLTRATLRGFGPTGLTVGSPTG